MITLMTSNPIPERLAEPAQYRGVSRLSALPIMAVAGMALLQIGAYGSILLYVIRFESGHPVPNAFVASPTLGMALGALMLPPAILLILRRNRGGGTLLRRSAVFLPLAAIFAACLLLRRQGDGEWEYGTIRLFLATMGARGIIGCGMMMLFFTVVPKGCRGFWYGCAVSTGFLCWEIVQALVPETETLAPAVSLYNSVFGAQTVVYCVLAAIVVLGFAMRPAPEEKPAAAEPKKRGQAWRLAGTLFLFYAANGFMQMRLFPEWVNPNAERGLWAMHALVFLACPIYGLFLDRRRDGAKKLMRLCAVFLLLAPTLASLTGSPAMYSIILSAGTLAQFAMQMVVLIALMECGESLAWLGWAYCLQYAFRLGGAYIAAVFREMPEIDGGLSTLLATVAALAFFVAAQRWGGGADTPAPADSSTDNKDANAPAEKYTLEQFLAHPSLSPREREVAALWLKGAGNREVALALGISESTVKTHIRNILSKLGAPNRTALLLRSIEFSPEK